MAKRKISAKQAVADIRSGMDDAALMIKYGLASDGLQSLFDKLVAGGYIDLGEVQERMPGFLGTVVISESDLSPKKGETREVPLSLKSKSSALINAQEAARDIRAGMDDPFLMKKYRLSSKGIQTLFNKLMAARLITQADLDRRSLGIEDTVDLREEMVSLSQALKHLFGQPAASTAAAQPDSEQSKANHIVKDSTKKERASSDEKEDKTFQEAKRHVEPYENPWYDNPIIVMLLVFVLFPLGFYALYQNSRLSTGIKAFIIVSWLLLAIVFLILFAGKISPGSVLDFLP